MRYLVSDWTSDRSLPEQNFAEHAQQLFIYLFIYLFTYNYILVNSFSCVQLWHERGLKIDVLSGSM